MSFQNFANGFYLHLYASPRSQGYEISIQRPSRTQLRQDVGVYLLVYISCRDAEWHPRVYTYSSLDQGSTLHPSPSSDASSFSCYGNELPCSMFLGGFGGYTLSPNLELNRQNAFPRR